MAELPPTCSSALSGAQKRYLESRGFEDPDGLISTWRLMGVGPCGGRYANRILMPAIFKDVIVSWTARSIFSEAAMRYLSCPAKYEALPIKSIVYGWDLIRDERAVVVEGPFDALKMGPGAVATLGTAWTPAQLQLLSGLKRVAVLFDSEPAAQRNAHELAEALATMGVKTEVVTLDDGAKDPGALSEDEAHELLRELLL